MVAVWDFQFFPVVASGVHLAEIGQLKCSWSSAVVMESDKVAVVFINLGSGNHRPPEITPDIFHHGSGVTSVWLCIDIEAFLVLPVTACLHLFERAAGPVFHFIEKGGAESIAQVSIVKVVDIAPGTVVAVAAF